MQILGNIEKIKESCHSLGKRKEGKGTDGKIGEALKDFFFFTVYYLTIKRNEMKRKMLKYYIQYNTKGRKKTERGRIKGGKEIRVVCYGNEGNANAH